MRNDFVIISSLFNIERENIDGRSWNEYLKWFEVTLKLKCPMIFFIGQDIRNFVEEKRLKIPTKIIIQTTEDIPYYSFKPELDSIIQSNEYQERISDSNRIECKYSMYSIIQYSKFKWLELAVRENPFNSKFFFWMDAGASRFFGNYDLSKNYPSPNGLEALEEMGDKFLIQMNTEYYPDLANAETLSEDYLLDSRSFTLGSFFGGTESAIRQVALEIEDILLNKMIAEKFINNEQISLGYLLKTKPELFAQYERYNGEHMDLFGELAKL